jgi:hypothetical protein
MQPAIYVLTYLVKAIRKVMHSMDQARAIQPKKDAHLQKVAEALPATRTATQR